ncbi:MAG: molybdenum cofactor guanylyltransferase [Candidatus Cloacimonetes bacterium]|nr:molybdenum cofactor guanylyltransferase [Candidatus Cloacimonadota bacterium]
MEIIAISQKKEDVFLKHYDIFKDVSGVVLAGGQNTRFKSEKSLIEVDDQCIIEKEINILKNIFAELIIVTDKEDIKNMFPNITFAKDYFNGCGPLAGLHAALKKCSTKGVFIVACDMPNLNERFIIKQLDLLEQNPNVLAVVPRHPNGYEPLHSFYHKNCLPFVEALLQQKKYSVRGFFNKISINWFDIKSEDEKFFFNINTQRDLELFIDQKVK